MKLTHTEARFLLAWNTRKDRPRNADGTVYIVPNFGRVLDSLIAKGMLESGRHELTVSAQGIAWCAENHTRFVF